MTGVVYLACRFATAANRQNIRSNTGMVDVEKHGARSTEQGERGEEVINAKWPNVMAVARKPDAGS